MTLKKFAHKRIVQIFPSILMAVSIIAPFLLTFLFDVSPKHLEIFIYMTALASALVVIINIFFKPTSDNDSNPFNHTYFVSQKGQSDFISDPIYRHNPCNINHRPW